MLELVERGVNVSRHGEINGLALVIPFQGEATVEATGPVNGDSVEGFDGVD